MASKVKIISLEELQRMNTNRLLSRRKALLACEESFKLSDRYGYEDNPDPVKTGYVEFKDTSQWHQAYAELKQVLATREHLPGDDVRKQLRKEKARQAKSVEKRTGR